MKADTSFLELLAQNCGQIVEKVLAGMQDNRYKVGSGKISVPTTPVLYRWWFPEAFVKEVLVPYTKDYPSLKTLLAEVEKREMDEKMYYALYFGKSNNGKRRYCQHTTGDVHRSTLRRTIYGLCRKDKGEPYDQTKEPKITEILSQCYFEWISFGKEGKLVECIEGICIALGKYPLNVDGNPAISDKWRKELMDKRKLSFPKKK